MNGSDRAAIVRLGENGEFTSIYPARNLIIYPELGVGHRAGPAANPLFSADDNFVGHFYTDISSAAKSVTWQPIKLTSPIFTEESH